MADQKTLWIITGASKGFGRAIAVQASKSFPHSDMIFISRDEKGLDETRTLALQNLQQNCTVTYYVKDLSDLDTLESSLDQIFDKVNVDCV